MRRLKSPANDGGLPYLNSDFNDILQTEHIKSYASYLDSINDVQFGTVAGRNRGVILYGCRIVSADINTATFDFSNSLVYFPGLTGSGDFYQASDAMTSGGNFTINLSQQVCYLRRIDDNDTNRTFRDGANKGVIENKYFRVTQTPPVDPDETFIQFFFNSELNKLTTQRRYKRILKYFTADVGEVFLTGNISNFQASNGWGYDDMHGFRLCGALDTYDTRGRMVIGFNRAEATTPVDNTTLWDPATPTTVTNNSANIKNYGAIGNRGGGYRNTALNPQGPNAEFPSEFLQISEMPAHNHGGSTTDVVGDINHTHGNTLGNSYSNGGPTIPARTAQGNGNPDYGDSRVANTSGVNSGTLNHTHGINAQGGGQPHEIRNPYVVLAYYQKIQL